MKRLMIVGLVALVILPAVAGAAKLHHHRTNRAVRHAHIDRHEHVDLNLAIMASRQGDAKLVLIALEEGDSVNLRDDDGATPLINAARQNWPQLTRLLIKMGADVAAEDKSGLNALDYAKTPTEIAVLLNAGAKGSKQDLAVNGDALETEDALNTKYVDGYLDNGSKTSYDYVEVDAVFFDSAGNQIDSGMDNTQHLAAGATWKFKINSFRDGVVSYKIVKVSGN